jgi:hypothetical protein
LSSRDLENKDWKVVEPQLIKSYGTQINTTATCIGISKLYKGSNSLLDYFSEASKVCRVLIKPTPKDYVTDLTFPLDIITEEAAGAHNQLNVINFISDANEQALKKHWVRKLPWSP